MLERDEGLRRVLPLAEKAESGEERNLVDAFALSEEVLDPFHRVQGPVEGRLGRGLHVDGQKALIVDRQEAGRQA